MPRSQGRGILLSPPTISLSSELADIGISPHEIVPDLAKTSEILAELPCSATHVIIGMAVAERVTGGFGK